MMKQHALHLGWEHLWFRERMLFGQEVYFALICPSGFLRHNDMIQCIWKQPCVSFGPWINTFRRNNVVSFSDVLNATPQHDSTLPEVISLCVSFSGTSPVYVPSTRAMLPVQYMGTPTQNMATPTTSSHLWTSPNDVTAYTPANTLHSSAAYSFNSTTSQGSGRNDGAAGFASPLGRHGGMGGYPTYMGAELSPWNTFNNLTLQQGFRVTTGPGKCMQTSNLLFPLPLISWMYFPFFLHCLLV